MTVYVAAASFIWLLFIVRAPAGVGDRALTLLVDGLSLACALCLCSHFLLCLCVPPVPFLHTGVLAGLEP